MWTKLNGRTKTEEGASQAGDGLVTATETTRPGPTVTVRTMREEGCMELSLEKKSGRVSGEISCISVFCFVFILLAA